MTQTEASVALRPFYFAVHPDRFASHPQIRKQNERSLQIFNGYISDLFPVSNVIQPVKVKFSIADKQANSFREIDLHLVGTDPINIVRKALKSCDLNTRDIEKARSSSSKAAEKRAGAPFTSGFSYDNDLLKSYLRKKGKASALNLAEALTRCRAEASSQAKEAAEFRVSIKEDIDELKSRTGLRDILWEIDWAEKHIRRCLSNMHRFIDQANAETKQVILLALYKNVLRFGRGSFTCCDGSIQLGADNVPEQWEKACSEYQVRKCQIAELKVCVDQLQSTFGGATILTPYYKGLAQTVSQIQSLIIRVWNREALLVRLSQAAAGTTMEVVTSYDELSIGIDGRLLIPCNVDVASLVVFLEENAPKSLQVQREMQKTLEELELEIAKCKSDLGLVKLEWEPALQLEVVLDSVKRLRKANEETKRVVTGLSLLLSQNPTVHSRPDGTVSIPYNWK
ncbi:unnamed protein product [Caenorhabditis auriculariae]|uniref:T-cell activation inhibitor, mitochondrial n=1 Tax=Caenorhabditis auriculariae TaxID=2777116 RepID=A0A8S1GZ33_9PELO|nr:unnamed protein product [Caenorhabditis auriculariae]